MLPARRLLCGLSARSFSTAKAPGHSSVPAAAVPSGASSATFIPSATQSTLDGFFDRLLQSTRSFERRLVPPKPASRSSSTKKLPQGPLASEAPREREVKVAPAKRPPPPKKIVAEPQHLVVPPDQAVQQALGISAWTPFQATFLRYWHGCAHNLLVTAPTGVGKTAAYVVALYQQLSSGKDRSGSGPLACGPSARGDILLLVPTETLKEQVLQWWQRLAAAASPACSLRMLPYEEIHRGTDAPCVWVHSGRGDELLRDVASHRVRPDRFACVVVDECDAVVKPMSRHATAAKLKCRQRHPVAALAFLRHVVEARPATRLVFLSATLSSLTRRDLKQHGIIAERGAILLQADNLQRDNLPTGSVHSDEPQPADRSAQGKASLPTTIEHRYRLCPEVDDVSNALETILARHDRLLVVLSDDAASKEVAADSIRALASPTTVVSYAGDRVSDGSRAEKTVLVAGLADCRGLDVPELQAVVIVGPVVPSPTWYVHVSGRVGRFGRPGCCYSLLHSTSDLGSDRPEKLLSMANLLGVKLHLF